MTWLQGLTLPLDDAFGGSEENLSLLFPLLVFRGGLASVGSRSGDQTFVRSRSGDHTFEFLANHIQNDVFILISPNVFAEVNASLLQNPNLFRQVVTDLEQYPLAPTSIAKRSQYQPLEEITLASPEYFDNFVECQDSIYSSQGQVSSIRMTRFRVFEKMTMSGRRAVTAM